MNLTPNCKKYETLKELFGKVEYKYDNDVVEIAKQLCTDKCKYINCKFKDRSEK